jgi:hypothetical protein
LLPIQNSQQDPPTHSGTKAGEEAIVPATSAQQILCSSNLGERAGLRLAGAVRRVNP